MSDKDGVVQVPPDTIDGFEAGRPQQRKLPGERLIVIDLLGVAHDLSDFMFSQVIGLPREVQPGILVQLLHVHQRAGQLVPEYQQPARAQR